MAVLLGIADSIIPPKDENAVNWSTNKFGGRANWMEECVPESNPTCDNCQWLLYHVAQVYCPLMQSEYHRTLNVFGCISAGCQNKASSWKILRSQCNEKAIKPSNDVSDEKALDSKNSAETHWFEGANDWDNEADNTGTKNTTFQDLLKTQSFVDDIPPVSDLKAEVDSESGAEQQAKLSNDVPYFTPHYILAIDEPKAVNASCYKHERELLMEYERREGPLPDLKSKEKAAEKYEKSKVIDGDSAFHQFQKRVRRCPQQCLRYEWNGQPLMFSCRAKLSNDFRHMPACSNCQSTRVFEMQLMPALSWTLEVPGCIQETKQVKTSTDFGPSTNGHILSDQTAPGCIAAEPSELISKFSNAGINDNDVKRIEFGCLFIFTCSKSCNRTVSGHLKPVEEFVVLQPFPDHYQIENAMNKTNN